jgi:pilus assembly protein TadC
MKKLEISIGLLAGYLIAGLVNMFAFHKSWTEAFSDEKILAGLAGIALTIFFMRRAQKRKEQRKV